MLVKSAFTVIRSSSSRKAGGGQHVRYWGDGESGSLSAPVSSCPQAGL